MAAGHGGRAHAEPIEAFVERALYAADSGFYETGGRAGRRGASFLTSPEVGPLFGAVIARCIDEWWHDLDRPESFVVVDAGAGPGTLARAIAAAEPVCATALEIVCVERTAAQRARHPDGVRSVASLPDSAHVIVANELLDNLPFGVLERTDGGWSPVRVHPDGSTTPDTGGPRIPVVAAAAAWIGDARRRLRPGGRLVCFDYADTTASLARQPWTAWLRGFAGHEQVPPLVEPGTRDVTVVVPVDQLPAPDDAATQADWLRRHGIDDLVAEGRAGWEAGAATGDLAALRMRSRVSEAEALLDPDGLGAFWVAEWHA